MAKRAKMTVGERIAAMCEDEWHPNCCGPAQTRWLSRRIDAAIRRAANAARKDERKFMASIGGIVASKAANAAAWDVKLNQPNESSYAWTEAKYGPRPAKKARKK